MRVKAMECRARLSCRSPPRLSRCRLVWPLLAGIGLAPGEFGEGGVGADPAGVGEADQRLGGADRADAGALGQAGGEFVDEFEQCFSLARTCR